jgi:L,D-peptidoglycan transpeptidase YkuD (ErfK/YbiS/YcfS/YnhG family)
MKRSAFFLLALVAGALHADGQLLLVVAEDFNSSLGTLQAYEKSGRSYRTHREPVTVNLGRSGLAWGLGHPWEHGPGPEKHEGDGRAPAGVFDLTTLFGYAQEHPGAMPYRRATADLICVDDAAAPDYNTITPVAEASALRSFEWMRRDDDLYRLGITVAHNAERIPGRGSCIFMHIQKSPGAPTAGCTSMEAPELEKIAAWLDPAKNPLLVQLPASECPAIEARFPGVVCP